MLIVCPRILRGLPPVIDACSRRSLTRVLATELCRKDDAATADLLDLLKHVNDPDVRYVEPVEYREAPPEQVTPSAASGQRPTPGKAGSSTDEPTPSDEPDTPLRLVDDIGW